MWQGIAAKYGFQAGMLAGHVAEQLARRATRRAKRGWVRSLAPPLGFAAGQIALTELTEPYQEGYGGGYEEWEEWAPPARITAFNPNTWGRNRE